MVIVGGSPAATLWGVYELVERYGVRYLLSGDVYPETQQAFYLPEIDQVFEPTFRARWFKTMGDFAMGMEGWGMADYRPFLDQLAKLKFNRIRVGSSPSQPFLDLQIKGIQRQSAVLWYGYHYPITDDMPGRKLFGNESGVLESRSADAAGPWYRDARGRPAALSRVDRLCPQPRHRGVVRRVDHRLSQGIPSADSRRADGESTRPVDRGTRRVRADRTTPDLAEMAAR